MKMVLVYLKIFIVAGISIVADAGILNEMENILGIPNRQNNLNFDRFHPPHVHNPNMNTPQVQMNHGSGIRLFDPNKDIIKENPDVEQFTGDRVTSPPDRFEQLREQDSIGNLMKDEVELIDAPKRHKKPGYVEELNEDRRELIKPHYNQMPEYEEELNGNSRDNMKPQYNNPKPSSDEVKMLKVKMFYFQMQPVTPNSGKETSQIIYYKN